MKMYQIIDMTFIIQPSRFERYRQHIKACAGLDISKSSRCSGKHYFCFAYAKRAHGALGIQYVNTCDWGFALNDFPEEQVAVRMVQG